LIEESKGSGGPRSKHARGSVLTHGTQQKTTHTAGICAYRHGGDGGGDLGAGDGVLK
jgi:hypothetical protein